MELFRHHIFVCTQPKPEGVTSCPANRSLPVLRALEREILAQALDDQVQLTTCGCLGLCDEGPVMIVYPDGVWYRKVREQDVPEIVSSHLRSAKPVERLVWNDPAAMKAQSAEHRDRFRSMMKARDHAGTLPDDLNEMIRGFMPSRAILSGLELDLFTAIGEGASAEHVAKKIGGDPRATEMLLNALASLKLLEKKTGTFSPTPVSARFLSADSRDSHRMALLHIANIWHRWSTLTDRVRPGGEADRNDSPVKAFIAAMDRNARERIGPVLNAVGTAGVKRMLDLGGGSGAYSIAFAKANPDLHSDIMDQHEVVPLTRDYIREAGLKDRIRTKVGDMLRDPLGADYDLVLISAICHMFSPAENRRLFAHAFEALAPKGRIVVQDFILEPDKTAPRHAALFSLNMLVGTESGASYSEPEYAAWLQEAGFSEIRRAPLPGNSGLMIAVRA